MPAIPRLYGAAALVLFSIVVLLYYSAPVSYSPAATLSATHEAICASIHPIPADPIPLPPPPPLSSEHVYLNRLNADLVNAPGWVGDDGYWEVAAKPRANPNLYQALTVLRRKDPAPALIESLRWLSGKTMLSIGDSVIRDIMMRLCYHAAGVENPSFTDCHIPSVNFTIKHSMLYGLADYDIIPSLEKILSDEWPLEPVNFEARVIAAKAEMPEPDFVLVNAGPWDFKYMFQRDLVQGKNHSTLPPEDIKHYSDRAGDFFALLKRTFPTQKIVWVQLHPMSPDDFLARRAWASGNSQSGSPLLDPALNRSLDSPSSFPVLFNSHRLAQLSHTYRQASLDAELDFVDYWKVAESKGVREFIRPGDAVHPSEESIKTITDLLLWKLRDLARKDVML